MKIVLNGEKREAADGCTVRELLETLGIDGSRVAVELDGSIAKRETWGETRLTDGAQLEIVHFVGGGAS